MSMLAFRDLSIRSKLTSVSVASAVSALLLACAAFVAYDLVTFRESMAKRLAAEAEIVGYHSASALLFEDPETARRTLEALRSERGVLSATIYTAAGAPFAAYVRRGAARASEPLAAAPDYGYRYVGDHLAVLHPIVFDGERIGSVAIRSEVQEVRERAWRYLGIAFLVLLASLAGSVAITVWPRRLILWPIVGLANTAEVVSREKDYSVRAERRGNDEIGLLVDAFNEMLGNIQKQDRELREARDAALESSRLKSAFLANMSHEIRTPLNILLGYAKLLEEHLEDIRDDSQSEAVAAMDRGGQRLTETIEAILDMAKIETNGFPVRPVTLEVASIVAQEVGELEEEAAHRGVALECRVEEPGAVVVFDEYCLAHALRQLLTNALKFTREGEVSVRLYRAGDGALSIDVRDTGVGMDEAFLRRVFEPFSQEEFGYTRKFEGQGLGLALTRRYLELNGAAISVESRKGAGTRFTIRFPKEGEPPATAGARAGAGGGNGRVPGVLLVEDHADTREYLKMALGREWRTFEAASGHEARRVLESHPGEIHVVLMDVSLRGSEDGLAVTRSLRRDPRWTSLPVVAMTARAFPEDRARALDAGCSSFLAKPISIPTLQAVMSSLVGTDRVDSTPSAGTSKTDP